LGGKKPTIDTVPDHCPPTGYGPSTSLKTVQRPPPEIPVIPVFEVKIAFIAAQKEIM